MTPLSDPALSPPSRPLPRLPSKVLLQLTVGSVQLADTEL